jgi:hypothetical protein
MSIPTYAVLNDLPAPVTSGTTIQSFTDVLGDVWVAKNGVYGGAWKRARDALHGTYYRAAAYTWAVAQGNFQYDTVSNDPYGLYNLGQWQFNVPVAGIWRYWSQLAGTATAAGQYLILYTYYNGSASGRNAVSCAGAGTFDVVTEWVSRCAAGDILQTHFSASAALTGAAGNDTGLYIDYLGTG